jgi:hypothetical protein
VMPSEKPVKERGSRPADVQISRWRRGETNADFVHLSVILSESEGSRKLSLAAGSIGFARDDGLLDKNPSLPPPYVPIPRKINFCDLCGGINQRPDIFHDVKTNIDNLPRPQPAQN